VVTKHGKGAKGRLITKEAAVDVAEELRSFLSSPLLPLGSLNLSHYGANRLERALNTLGLSDHRVEEQLVELFSLFLC
jgi:hypothetical protein